MEPKKTSGTLLTFRSLISVPVLAILLLSFSACGSKTGEARLINTEPPQLPPPPPKPPTMQGNDTAWQIVDEIPLLPGGSELLMNYITKNIKYPDRAKEQGIQGKVIVKFFISSKGYVSGHEIKKSASPDLDAEALRVLKTITRFEPARRDGKAVPAWYDIPIIFTLK
jgi:TonB family protein